ncbi:nuclease, partial [Paenarthrobacter sp. CM16]|nr:nuclease [Paenarthrobacter sp. CM16]
MTSTEHKCRLLIGGVLTVLALTGCTPQGGPQVVPAGNQVPLQEVPCEATGTAARPPALQVTA